MNHIFCAKYNSLRRSSKDWDGCRHMHIQAHSGSPTKGRSRAAGLCCEKLANSRMMKPFSSAIQQIQLLTRFQTPSMRPDASCRDLAQEPSSPAWAIRQCSNCQSRIVSPDSRRQSYYNEEPDLFLPERKIILNSMFYQTDQDFWP